jgi:hypothetical protein
MQIGTLIRNTQAGQSAPHSVRFQSGPPVHCAGGFVGGRWQRCNVKFRLQDGGKHLRPEIKAGLLFNAKVTDDVILKRELFGHPLAMPVSASIQRLHLYQIVYKKPGTSGMEAANDSNVFLDGKRVGSLVGNQYACIRATPGTHILRVGHEAFSFDIDASQERYIRVVLLSVERGDRTISVTDGYELGSQALKPGRFKQQLGVSCFDPMSRDTNTQTE